MTKNDLIYSFNFGKSTNVTAEIGIGNTAIMIMNLNLRLPVDRVAKSSLVPSTLQTPWKDPIVHN